MIEHPTATRYRHWTDTPGARWRATCACGWRSDPVHPDEPDAVDQVRAMADAHRVDVAEPDTIEQALARWSRRYR